MRRVVCRIFVAVLLCTSVSQAVWATADIQEVEIYKGVKAWLVEDHALPIVSVKLAFTRSGFAYDPEEREGLASFVAALLTEGAGDYDSRAFHEVLEAYGIHLSASVDEDALHVSLKTLRAYQDRAMELLALALSAPQFDADAVERVRGQMLSALVRQRQNPQTVAALEWTARAFGEHPYGRSALGDEDSLKKLEVSDFATYVRNHLVLDGVVVSVAGDVDADGLVQLLAPVLVALPETPESELQGFDETVVTVHGEHRVSMDVPQGVVVFGHQGVKRDDPDFYAAYLVNHILGSGSFSSRLVEELRVKRGLAYSVNTSFGVLQKGGVFQGVTATRADKLQETLAVIRAEITRLQDEGITQTELDEARSYVVGSFPLLLDTTARLAGYLQAMQLYDLGQDYLDKRREYFDAVTPEDANRVARSVFLPEKLLMVVVAP